MEGWKVGRLEGWKLSFKLRRSFRYKRRRRRRRWHRRRRSFYVREHASVQVQLGLVLELLQMGLLDCRRWALKQVIWI